MIGSVMLGHIMDFSFKSRKTRGLAGITVVAVLGTGIWIGGFFNQRGYNYYDVHHNKVKILDFKTSGSDFAGPFVLYFSYGLLDAMFQSMVYWIIGGLADDSVILSRYILLIIIPYLLITIQTVWNNQISSLDRQPQNFSIKSQ